MRRSAVRAASRGLLALALVALALVVGALTIATSSAAPAASEATGSNAASAREGRVVALLGVTVDRPATEWIRGPGSRPAADGSGVHAVLVATLLTIAALLAWLACSRTQARRLTRRRFRPLGRAPPALRFA